jgi:hypothetical protein
MEIGEGDQQPSKDPEPSQVIQGPVERPSKVEKTNQKKLEKAKGKHFNYGREIDAKCNKGRIGNIFWNQEIRGLTIGEFFGSIKKGIQEEILDKIKRKKLVKGEGGVVVGLVFTMDEVEDKV